MKALRWDDAVGGVVLEKYCKKCDEFFPMTSEWWFKDKRARDGLRSICKGCYSELPSVLRRRHSNGTFIK